MRWRRRSLGTVTAALASATLLAVPASAEVDQAGGVRVSVSGNLAPNRLPRQGVAPVAVSVSGKIRPGSANGIPKLTAIEIGLNSHGRLRTEGVPVCRLGKIDPSTSAQALVACGSSLIGEGRFSADVRIPEQSPFPSRGKVLAFYGKLGGQPAIFAHIYGTVPVPTSYVLPFEIAKAKGTYGTVLSASLPRVTGEWGYVTGISLNLKRGFVAAGCPAPPGFSSAVFPLMRTRLSFAGGVRVSSTIIRSCKVDR
ncbi:MAG TPA: hypothetical protein VI039_12410 [Solirubrobacterales bacterium]